jgi:DNA polymerase
VPEVTSDARRARSARLVGWRHMSANEPDARAEISALGAALAAHLERAAEGGLSRVARARSDEKGAISAEKQPSAPVAARPAAELVPQAPPKRAPSPADPLIDENRRRAAACASLGELRALVAGCRACGLEQTRTQTVFADGREGARVLFVGEAPGETEDLQGVPFVGAAGQLLTDIIQKGMGLARSEVYIANILKCHPPGNRDPAPAEKALCTPYLDRQIELLDPELVVALGTHAAQHLLKSELSIGRLRGKVHQFGRRKLVATYHPAYLLRTPGAKKDCWQDIQLAMRELGIAPPPRPRAPGDPGDPAR